MLKCPECSNIFPQSLFITHMKSHKEKSNFAKVLEDNGKIKNRKEKENKEKIVLRNKFCERNKTEKRRKDR